jgi:hypothetical protein
MVASYDVLLDGHHGSLSDAANAAYHHAGGER